MSSFLDLGDEQYVLLTTFRKTGVGVPTAVWVGKDGDALIVTTIHNSGKVKRIRNNPLVELTPCNRVGEVTEGAPTFRGQVEIFEDPASRAVLEEVFAIKYTEAFARIKKAADQRPPELRSVTLRITPAA